jgi:hypothetical protein
MAYIPGATRSFVGYPFWEIALIRGAGRQPNRNVGLSPQVIEPSLAPGSKFTQDVLPIPLEPLGDCGLSYPIQVVDGPLQLVERELGGLSVSRGFPRTVPNALLARVH